MSCHRIFALRRPLFAGSAGLLLACAGGLSSCITQRLWDCAPESVEHRAVCMVEVGAQVPGIWIPAQLLPGPLRDTNPPLQPWLEVRATAVAEAAALGEVRLSAGQLPGDLLARVQVLAAAETVGGAAPEVRDWCTARFCVAPRPASRPQSAVVVTCTLREPTIWWRGLLTPFAFALDVALLPFELLGVAVVRL